MGTSIGAIVRRAAILGAMSLAACGNGQPDRTQEVAAAGVPGPRPQPSTATVGEWHRASGDVQGTRFSPLAEIDTANVGELAPAWTFSTGVVRGHEAAPLVVGSTMYVVTPYPNLLYALDLSASEPRVLWTYEPKPEPAAQGVACCDVVNRGAVHDGGRIFFATLDGNAIAVDAETGTEVWRTRIADIQKGETITMAPLVVGGRVFVGNSGGEMGVRGKLVALDTASGSVAWTAYSTGPDAEVLIGEDFRPFYANDRVRDLGVSTWPPEAWQTGGGAPWGWITYDPTLDLLYYGTGNPGPWNPEQRPGDNKWTSSVFARDPETGAARWAYQWSPHDLFDYDGINENIVLDLPIGGRTRQVIVHPERNGFLYVIDRATGEVLSAEPFAYVTTTERIDLETGRPVHYEDKEPRVGEVVRHICPAAPGAKDWQPASFSPRTGLLYVPVNNLCMDFEGLEVNYIAGTPYVGANVVMYAGPGGHRGELLAWDPVAARPVWRIRESFPIWSGTLVTAGGLVFYGTMDGWFKAVDARSGRLLWRSKVDSGIVGQPVTYRGPDGRQYVAVLAGVGGWAGAVVAGDLDVRDPSAALGFAGAMGDLPEVTEKGGTLHVYALP